MKWQGFLLNQYKADFPTGRAQLAEWMVNGELQYQETVVNGFSRMGEALVGLLKGRNTGKLIVMVNDDDIDGGGWLHAHDTALSCWDNLYDDSHEVDPTAWKNRMYAPKKVKRS